MIAAVDANIILDILIPDDPFAESSKRLLDRRLSDGTLILCEVVHWELAAHFPSEADLKKFLFSPSMRSVTAYHAQLHPDSRM